MKDLRTAITRKPARTRKKIVSDNAGEAANNMTAQDAQKATQSEGTTAGGQTITAEGNEAQRASQSPTQAASNAEPGRVSQSPAEAPQGQKRTAGGQRTTGTDTRPPRAAERAGAGSATTQHRTRGAPRKVTFSAQMRKFGSDPPEI